VPVHQDERLRRLAGAARPDSALARFTGDLCPAGWYADRVLSTARTQGAAALLTLAPELSRRWASRHLLRFATRRLADTVLWRLAPLHTLIKMRGLKVVLQDEHEDLAEPVAAGLPGRFYLPVKVLGARGTPPLPARPRLRGARRLILRGRRALLAPYHQARGRLVVIPAAGALRAPGKAPAAASPWPGPDLVLALAREGATGRAPIAPGQGAGASRAAVVACIVQHGDDDLRRVRGLVLHTIWLAYARRRRWGSGDASASRGPRLADDE